MKTGIFGGTFNPPHMGHLIVAEHVRVALRLDRVIFIPTFVPPHKQGAVHASGEARLAMVQLAVGGNPHFQTSNCEILRGGVSYTVDTLEIMQKEHPGDELFLLIGMDNLVDFATWRNPDRIVRLARLVVMTRPGFEAESAAHEAIRNAALCPVPQIGISSTMIRERVLRGESIRYLVPLAVEEYIEREELYREGTPGVAF